MGLFDSLKRDKKEETTVVSTPTTESPANIELNLPEVIPSAYEGGGAYGVVEPIPVMNDPSTPLPDYQIPAEDGYQAANGQHSGVNSQEAFAEGNDPSYSYQEQRVASHAARSTVVVAIINQKGGVGKTTTAINLSAALGEMGKKVLLIDFDPQGNSSSGLGIEKSRLNGCIYNVLLEDTKIEEVTIPNAAENLDLAPATINLAGAEVELVSEIARENRLNEAISAVKGRYDYVFIDCPPSLGLLTVNALVAADRLIIPIQTEFYALEGVTKLLESMKRVKNRLNPELEILGILLTMYDGRTTLSRQVAAEVRNYFGRQSFDTIIPRTVKLSEAPSYGIPITQYDPFGKGAMAYKELAKEVMKRG